MAEMWDDLLAIVGSVQWLLAAGADASAAQSVLDLVRSKENAATLS